MTTSSISFELDEIPNLPPALRSALCDYLLQKLDGIAQTSLAPTPAPAPIKTPGGIAQLSATEAERFLENCGAKSISVLKQIVKRGGNFALSDIAAALKLPQGDLGGVWGGLTKRTRTVTNDRSVYLIDWKKVGSRWLGSLSAQSTKALEAALQNY